MKSFPSLFPSFKSRPLDSMGWGSTDNIYLHRLVAKENGSDGYFSIQENGVVSHVSRPSHRNTIFTWLRKFLKESTGMKSLFPELGWLRKPGLRLGLQGRLFLERAETCGCFSSGKMPHSDSRLLNWWHWQLMRRWYHPLSAGHRREKRVILRAMRYKTSGNHTAIAQS